MKATRAIILTDEAVARFKSRLEPQPSGCIEYVGYRNTKGYGHMSVNGGKALAHRYAWVLAHGAIPDGLYVLHRCDNPPCCNPAHLFLGTIADNNADRDAKGRCNAGVQNREKTACPKGHPYDLMPSNGSRKCRRCVNEYARAYNREWRRARREARVAELEAEVRWLKSANGHT